MDKEDIPLLIVKHMELLGKGRDEEGAYLKGVKDACFWLDSELQAQLSIGAARRAEVAIIISNTIERFEKALKCVKGGK